MSLTESRFTPRPFSVRLPQFEGPLDLLLYLIQSQELDISTVSISRITHQYLNTLKLMQEMDFDIASEFLLMAATLILWKSRALMPKEEDPDALLEENTLPLTQEELVRQLRERQRYLEMANLLSERPLQGYDVFTRPNKRAPVEKIWKEMNSTSIATTFQDLLIREQKRARIVMKKETVSLQEKIQEFIRKLPPQKIMALETLISDTKLRGDWVVGFLAALELSRLRKLLIHQEKTFDPIYVEMIEDMIHFDSRQISGFDYVRTGEVTSDH